MNKQEIKVVAVSGGFDPVHIGHVRMFEKAKALGTHLVVILNCDEWLKRKKGFVFMPEKERAEIIEKFAVVDDVYIHYSDDSHVSKALENYRMKIEGKEYQINIFANGGDRKNKNDIPETNVCEKNGIEMVFNVGEGGKVQSSSWLTNAISTQK
jgi:D-beta-D-heptose 7-phosphate kinase/D-beta-D-heptose 1-phosphate adenosyltransferase